MVPAFSYNKFLAFAPVLHPQTLHVPSSLSLDRFAVTIWNLGAFGPFLPFRAVLPVPLGIGTLGRRVAPHSVPYTISQVCLASCQPGMSPQSASRGPVERVYVHVPRLWERRCPQRTAGGLGRTSDDFVPSLEFQAGSCLYVTAAV